jgi:sugar phosphate isomerase/epimerase
MPAPIALQLYTLREEIRNDFAGTIRQVARIGYAGVEPSIEPGAALPAGAATLFRDLGLAVPSAIAPLPLGEHRSLVLDSLAQLGCQRLVCPMLDLHHFTSLAALRRGCDLLNEANAVATGSGLTLGYHTHWWEFEPLEGRIPLDVMLEHLQASIFFEVDTYWVGVGGADASDLIKRLGIRSPLLHLKDGPGQKDGQLGTIANLYASSADPDAAFEQSVGAMIQVMSPLGEGTMDFPAIVTAGAPWVEWLIVELDACAIDVMTAVDRSHRYLVGAGLARGKD